MSMRLVREDEQGVYLKYGESKYRPGDVTGMSHAVDQSNPGLKKGDKVKATFRFLGGMFSAKLIYEGQEYWWADDFFHQEERKRHSEDAAERAAAQSLDAIFFEPINIVKVNKL